MFNAFQALLSIVNAARAPFASHKLSFQDSMDREQTDRWAAYVARDMARPLYVSGPVFSGDVWTVQKAQVMPVFRTGEGIRLEILSVTVDSGFTPESLKASPFWADYVAQELGDSHQIDPVYDCYSNPGFTENLAGDYGTARPLGLFRTSALREEAMLGLTHDGAMVEPEYLEVAGFAGEPYAYERFCLLEEQDQRKLREEDGDHLWFTPEYAVR